MAGITALANIYNPLAKVEAQDVACNPAEDHATSCGAADKADPDSRSGIQSISIEKIPMQSWCDSEPVIALSSFLKSPDGHGIQMTVEKNSFSLKFKPGLRPDRDPERWQRAQQASGLLIDAVGDLPELNDLGVISRGRTGSGPGWRGSFRRLRPHTGIRTTILLRF